MPWTLEKTGSHRVTVDTELLPSTVRPGALLTELAGQADPVVLDSAAFDETQGRYTILACCPLDVLTLREGVLTSARNGVLARRTRKAIWSALAGAFGHVSAPPCGLPYAPGWIGYVGYEVGRHVERLPGRAARDTHLPDLRMAFYDAVLVYDAAEEVWSLLELRFDHPPAGAGHAATVLRQVLADTPADPADLGPARVDQADASPRPTAQAVSPFAPAEYRDAVAQCVDYIAAGDIFQVNLSQRFTLEATCEPLRIYQSLRRRNPAWYGAYLQFRDTGAPCAILSSSPELFLAVRDRHVVTRPIKGTRRRTGDDRADAQAADDLLASPKDNAELAMIIDLLRNDLGRVCDYGSVRVTEPRRLETHPTVYHLVGTVEGELRPDVGPAELLRATFPGGSITGAPKIRAMEIIDEIEPTARGVYTGCIGHVGVDGQATWNIAIRTIVCDGPSMHVQAGGGIVADSDPESERQETEDKARALLEAIAEARTPAADPA